MLGWDPIFNDKVTRRLQATADDHSMTRKCRNIFANFGIAGRSIPMF